MSLVVLDVVNLGSEVLDIECFGESRADIADPGGIFEPSLQVAGARAVSDRPQELAAKIRPRVARDSHMVQVLWAKTRVLQAPPSGVGRKPRAVLDPVEPLLLGRGHQFPVDHERRGCVAVVGVQPEDRRHAADASDASTRPVQ